MQTNCSSCGAANPSGKVLCISCGKALVHASASPAANFAQPASGAYQTPYQASAPTSVQSVSPPVMPPAIQPMSSSPVQRPQVVTPATFNQADLSRYWARFLERPENWLAAALTLFFFFPWVTVGGFISISGYQLPDVGRGVQQIQSTFNPNPSVSMEAVLLNLVYLIPILAIATIVMNIRGKDSKIVGLAAGIVPLVVFALMLLRIGGTLLQVLGLGAYLTVAAAIGMIVVVSGAAKGFRRS